MQGDADVEVVRRLIELIGTFEIDDALELVTDDVVLEFPFRGDGGPRILVGDDAKHFVRAMPKLFSQLPFVDIVVHGKVPSGTVVVEYRGDGITKKGRPYSNRYVAFFELRDGRVAHWREYFDPTIVTAAFPVD